MGTLLYGHRIAIVTAMLLLSVVYGVFVWADGASNSEIPLPAPTLDGKMSLEQALKKRRSIRSYSDSALTLAEVSQLLWAAQGITDASGHRTAPSAMATYPLEVYLIAGNVADTPTGVYHYRSYGHKLEPVISGDQRTAVSSAALGQSAPKNAPASILIAAVYSRTAAKCGDKAQRFVHIEAGAAGQNILLQATALGLGAVGMGGFDDTRMREVLNLPENHIPLYLIPVGRAK